MDEPSPPDRPSIFRAEAIEHRDRRQRSGDVLRAAPGWINWAFYLLIGLVIAGLVAASIVDIDRYVTGPTASESGRIVVLLPATQVPEVSKGQPVEVGATTARVVSFRDEILYPDDGEELGVELAVPSVAVVTSARAGDSQAGTARVLVESEPVIVALIPGLSAIFGGE